MALGRGIHLVPGQSQGLILNWVWPQRSPIGQRDPYCEDQESKTTSILIDRDVGSPVNPATDTVETAFCTVKFSAGGMFMQFVEVDVQSGTLLTVVGSEISISASYPTIPGFTHPEMDVRAVLGFDGGRASAGVTSIPRRTVRLGTILPGAGSGIFPIPRFAVAAFMRNSNIATPFATLIQHRAANAGNNINTSVIGKLDQDSAPIANGALFFSVLNNTPDPLTDASVVFYIGL